eukprot:COSAG01_NODE_8076_length_2930_cov_6.566231_2_plen_55_part_00
MLAIGNDMDGTVGVLAKLNKMKEADKRIKVRSLVQHAQNTGTCRMMAAAAGQHS